MQESVAIATAAEFRTQKIFWPCCIIDQKLCHMTVTESWLWLHVSPLKVKHILVSNFLCLSWTLGTLLPVQLTSSDTIFYIHISDHQLSSRAKHIRLSLGIWGASIPEPSQSPHFKSKNQNLHFGKITRKFKWILKFEKLPSVPSLDVEVYLLAIGILQEFLAVAHTPPSHK